MKSLGAKHGILDETFISDFYCVDLAEKGVGLLMVASELEEVIGLCDRCLVIADGRIVDEFKRGEGSEEKVLRAVAAAQAATQRAALAGFSS